MSEVTVSSSSVSVALIVVQQTAADPFQPPAPLHVPRALRGGHAR
ncbi:MAG: hypothetical protein U5O69_06465 [Candidatus Competibacteraceae bacterium]|nr:hypothetical protein [Candidatus Competibacteraceae bacterium]